MKFEIERDDLLELRDAANDSGWIAWHGGDCPVSKYTLVEVRNRGWPDMTQPAKPAGEWRWRHSSTDNQEWLGDIVGYRVLEDATALAGELEKLWESLDELERKFSE